MGNTVGTIVAAVTHLGGGQYADGPHGGRHAYAMPRPGTTAAAGSHGPFLNKFVFSR
jgi:hypothetical protein